MKKNIAIAALAAALLLTGCSNGNSSASEQSSSSASESASTAEAELKTIDVRFGFSADGISDYAAYICGSGAYPDEFGVFTADSAEKADEIKTALEKRVDNQKSTYQDYTPDEMYKFDDCFVKQDGNTVYYAVTADNTKAADILG